MCVLSNGAMRTHSYLGVGDVSRRADPFDGVADFLNGIDERADIARHVVEEVDGRHGGRGADGSQLVMWKRDGGREMDVACVIESLRHFFAKAEAF